MTKLNGNGVSQGIAIGKIFLYHTSVYEMEEEKVGAGETGIEVDKYTLAKKKAMLELQSIIDKMNDAGDKDKAGIFVAHQEFLKDESIDEEIQQLIDKNWMSAGYAIFTVYNQYIDMFRKNSDSLFQERAADLDDVKVRLLRCLEGKEEVNLSNLSASVIVAAKALFPSNTATIDREHVLALLTEADGITSHTAIIAKSYGIPAILGIKNVMELVYDGQEVIVDAVNGILITEPSSEEIRSYTKMRGEC